MPEANPESFRGLLGFFSLRLRLLDWRAQRRAHYRQWLENKLLSKALMV